MIAEERTRFEMKVWSMEMWYSAAVAFHQWDLQALHWQGEGELLRYAFLEDKNWRKKIFNDSMKYQFKRA